MSDPNTLSDSDTRSRLRRFNWALSQHLTARQKLVLLVLAALCTDGDSIMVAKSVLGRDTSLDRNGLKRQLAALEEHGLIRIEPTKAEDGGSLANRYTLLIPSASAAQSELEARGAL